VKEVLARASAGGNVTVRGWLKTARHAKGLSFLEVSDGSSFAGIQVVAEPSLTNYESELKHLQAGSAVTVEGELVESPGKEQRFDARRLGAAARRRGARRFHPGLLRPRGASHRVRTARSGDRGARARQRLYVRPDVSRRELEHEPASRRVLDGRAGDGLLRSRG